jgi:DNA-binding winged helix-turn-helix (wHTH) protein/TolB-like protein
MIYEFDQFQIDIVRKCLWRNGQVVPIQPKVFDILTVLAEKQGEIISRHELMQIVWKDTFVEESNLRFCIHSLRKTLGKNADGEDYIETIPKRGYRLTAQINEKSEELEVEKFDEKFSEVIPKTAHEVQFSQRTWLIGILILLLVSLLIVFYAWQKDSPKMPKNAFAFNTLAVLPFESAGESQSDLQIGLADSMITNLSKLKNFKVLPLASVRKFAGQNFDASQVGKELQTDAVLSGTYRFDGENMRVSVNLLRVKDGEKLWSETFSTQSKRALDLENAIALRTARLLSLKIAEDEDEQSLANQKLNSEAVQNYLSARKIWRSGELFRRKEMVGLFEKTITLEPNWALAYTGFAAALMASDGGLISFEKLEQTANEASKLDVSLAYPQGVLGNIYSLRDWDWKKAEIYFKNAISLDPKQALLHYEYSEFLRIQKRFGESEAEIKRAIELEPFSPLYYSSLCELRYFDRKYDDALLACHISQQLEPSFWRADKLLFWIYIQKKTYHEIKDVTFSKLATEESAKANLKHVITKDDLRPYWQNSVEKLLARYTDAPRPLSLATAYLQLGEKEKALDYLEQALAQRAINLPLANVNPAFDSIRNEKRFEEVMRKVGLQK